MRYIFSLLLIFTFVLGYSEHDFRDAGSASLNATQRVVILPMLDTSIVHDTWSDNDVGFDLTTAKGYLMIGSMAGDNAMMVPLRIELPMVLNHEYKGGNNAGNGASGWEIRAIAHSTNVLSIAGAFNASTSHSSTLQYIKWYK